MTADLSVTVSGRVGAGADAHRLVTVGTWGLTVWETVGDGEPRLQDIEAGRRLGFGRPRKIRELIGRTWPGDKIRQIHVRPTVGRTSMPRGGYREETAEEFWLTEAQLLKLCARGETKVGDAVLDEMIHVCMLARRGLLSSKCETCGGTRKVSRGFVVFDCPKCAGGIVPALGKFDAVFGDVFGSAGTQPLPAAPPRPAAAPVPLPDPRVAGFLLLVGHAKEEGDLGAIAKIMDMARDLGVPGLPARAGTKPIEPQLETPEEIRARVLSYVAEANAKGEGPRMQDVEANVPATIARVRRAVHQLLTGKKLQDRGQYHVKSLWIAAPKATEPPPQRRARLREEHAELEAEARHVASKPVESYRDVLKGHALNVWKAAQADASMPEEERRFLRYLLALAREHQQGKHTALTWARRRGRGGDGFRPMWLVDEGWLVPMETGNRQQQQYRFAVPTRLALPAPRPVEAPANAELLRGALVRLGYKKHEARRAVEALGDRVATEPQEDLIRAALAALAPTGGKGGSA